MRAIWRWMLIGGAVFAALLAIGLGLLLFVGLPELASAIEIDGQRIDLVQLQADHWALMGLGVVIAAIVLAVVVPLLVVAAVAVPLAGIALAVAVAAAALGIVLAPIGLLVWWLWKAPVKKARMSSP